MNFNLVRIMKRRNKGLYIIAFGLVLIYLCVLAPIILSDYYIPQNNKDMYKGLVLSFVGLFTTISYLSFHIIKGYYPRWIKKKIVLMAILSTVVIGYLFLGFEKYKLKTLLSSDYSIRTAEVKEDLHNSRGTYYLYQFTDNESIRYGRIDKNSKLYQKVKAGSSVKVRQSNKNFKVYKVTGKLR